MRLRIAGFAALMAGPLAAETVPMDCAALTATLGALSGYSLTAPPAAPENGWCVLDGAVLRAEGEGRPNISAKRLRIQGTEVEGLQQSLSLEITGLRVAPRLGDRTVDERLRAALRLQTADLRLTLRRSSSFEGVRLEEGALALSGGTELVLLADLEGADFTAASLLSATVTQLYAEWRNDGRLLRPLMEAAGEKLVEGALGSAAVDAARVELGQIMTNLPAASLLGESARELDALVEALPQGRGRLVLALDSDGGIGAARLAIAALSKDPTGPDALARLFSDSTLSVDWQPGLGE